MPLFPELPEQFLNDTDRRIRGMASVFYSQCYPITQSFWYEANLDAQWVAGDQRYTNDIYGIPASTSRKYFNINMMRPIINSVSGFQRKNRKTLQVVPIENATQQTADDFTKTILWALNNDTMLETFSDAFEGACITGMSLLHVWMDYRNDPMSGVPRISHKPYNSFIIDPFFRDPSLKDCNGIFVRDFVSKADAMSLFPDRIDDIMALPTYNTRDGKFQLMPENINLNTLNLLTYDSFYYRDYRKQTIVSNLETGLTVEWHQSEEELEARLAEYPQLMKRETIVPTVRLAIMVQGRVFYDGLNETGLDIYPFIPMLGYFHPELPDFAFRYQGIARGLRDIQFLYNRHRVIQMDIMESMPNAGWIVKENALVNPKDTQKTGQGIVLFLKESAQMTDITQIQAPTIQQGYFAITDMLREDFNKVSGISEEALGASVENIAGYLSMLRQSAGLTQFQGILDGADRSLKHLGKVLLQMIQNNFTPGKVERIIGREVSQEFYDKTFGTYDCTVEEGMYTSTQKQMQLGQVIELIQLGVPIPHEYLLHIAPLQDKNDLMQYMQQQQQAREQAEQQKMQIEMQEQEARTNLANARAEADRGLGAERYSRIEENRAMALKQLAESNKEDELALLNKIKILRELESIDISHITQLLAMVNSLKVTEVEGQKPQPQEA